MEKLDRLGWAAELSFEAFGVAIGIRTNDAGLLKVLSPYLPPGLKAVSNPVVQRLYSLIGGGAPAHTHIRRMHLLYANAQRIARTAEVENLLEILRSDVNLYVAESAPRQLFVHAGAVGWKGRAIVIPGPSFSGKTTLVQEFLRAGASYYSDEFTVLDERGFVHPFAARLSARSGNSARAELRQPEEFGSRAGVRALPIGCILATHYDPSAQWKPKHVQRARCLGFARAYDSGSTKPFQSACCAVQSCCGRAGFQRESRRSKRASAVCTGAIRENDLAAHMSESSRQDFTSATCFIPKPNKNIIVEEVLGELLIYDLKRNIVRRLNRLSAAIWEQCDGRANVKEIARIATSRFANEVDEQTVMLALRRLSRAHLLEGEPPEVAPRKRVSRREWIALVGMGAVPLVTSMVVPTPAQAASCLPLGSLCSSNSQCCSGNCIFVAGMGLICQ